MFGWGAGIGKVLRKSMHQDRMRREEMALRQLRVSRFCREKVVPALESLRPELEAHGRSVEIRRDGNIVHFIVYHQGRVEFRHSVLASRRRKASTGTNYRDRQGYGRNVDQVYSLRDMRWLSKNTIIKHVVIEFRKVVATARRAQI